MDLSFQVNVITKSKGGENVKSESLTIQCGRSVISQNTQGDIILETVSADGKNKVVHTAPKGDLTRIKTKIEAVEN